MMIYLIKINFDCKTVQVETAAIDRWLCRHPQVFD